MNTLFPVKVGDTKRFPWRLWQNGKVVPHADVTSCTLKVHVNGANQFRTGVKSGGDWWYYEMTSADYATFTAAEYDCEMVIVFADGHQETGPVEGTVKLRVNAVL